MRFPLVAVPVLLDVGKTTENLGNLNAVNLVTSLFVQIVVLTSIVLELAASLLDTPAITTSAGTSPTSNLTLRVTGTIPSGSGDVP